MRRSRCGWAAPGHDQSRLFLRATETIHRSSRPAVPKIVFSKDSRITSATIWQGDGFAVCPAGRVLIRVISTCYIISKIYNGRNFLAILYSVSAYARPSGLWTLLIGFVILRIEPVGVTGDCRSALILGSGFMS